jgi:hypothetical protein
MLAPITASDSALTQNASVTLLESALAKSLDLKLLRINTCKKGGGSPLPWLPLPQRHMRRAQQLGRECRRVKRCASIEIQLVGQRAESVKRLRTQ